MEGMSAEEVEKVGKGLQVLLVDDEPLILDLLSDFFEAVTDDLKMEVEEDSAASIEEAWDKMNAKDYDLVLIDYNLPDGTGPDLVREYVDAKRKNNGKMPLFALSSGYEAEDFKDDPNASLFFSILTKPISMEQFKQLLLKVQKHRR